MPDTDEQALIGQAQRDPQAFAALYDRYVDRIYVFVYRRTHDEASAQDVTSVTFEKALRHLGRFRWQGVSFGAWLYRIARNEIAQHHRRQRFTFSLSDWHALEGATGTAAPTHEAHADLQAAFSRLSDNDQELLTLRFYEDLSSAEVAAVLGCSTPNVYLRLHRALGRLRHHLEATQGEAYVAQ